MPRWDIGDRTVLLLEEQIAQLLMEDTLEVGAKNHMLQAGADSA